MNQTPEQLRAKVAKAREKYKILLYFDFEHLPPHLQAVSSTFRTLAYHLATELPPSAELSTALRKLLECKDAAVRAALPTSEDTKD